MVSTPAASVSASVAASVPTESTAVSTLLVEGLVALVSASSAISIALVSTSSSTVSSSVATESTAVSALLVEGLVALVSTLVSTFVVSTLLVMSTLLVVSTLLVEGLASLMGWLVVVELGLAIVLLSLLGGGSWGFLLLIIIFLIILIIVQIVIDLKIILNVFKIFKIFILLILFVFLISNHGGGLGWLSLDCLGLGSGLGFGGGDLRLGGLGSRSGNGGNSLGGLNFFLFAFLVILLLILLLIILFFVSKGEVSVLFGLEESNEVDGGISLDDKGDFIDESNEEVDSGLGLVLGERDNEEFLVSLLDVEGCLIAGAGGEGDVGDGEDIASSLVDVLFREGKGGGLVDHFSEKHGGC